MSVSIGIGETEDEKMGDHIDRRAAIDALEKEKPTPFVHEDGSIDPFGAGRQNQWYRDGIAIMNLPPTDVKIVKHGYWNHDCDDELVSGTCSVCGWQSIIMETDVADMPYCPNCGSKMDEVEDNG